MGYRVGVDIGGTFTDFCVFDEDSSALRTLKVLSRPDAPGAEVLQGLDEIERRFAISPRAISYFTHGSTVGVNSIIQGTGAKLCLFVTAGFRDVLELARLKIPDPYDLFSRRPPPLVPRDRVIELGERMNAAGEAELVPSDAAISEALRQAERAGAEGIVLAFLHSYTNPAHERLVKARIAELSPSLPVFCSADVWPIVREYERTITACIHGSVQPRVSHYIGRLEAALTARGVAPAPMITKSNGGVMTAAAGKDRSIEMLLSGTAAGVIGAGFVAQRSGFSRVMSLDIGGTSADVALLRDGMPDFRSGELVGRYPIYLPTVSVSSIGAGGGSVASVDTLGVLRVGPESAGSTPGPACYGRGGERATITDAFAALGVLGSGGLGYGAVNVDRERALAVLAPLAAGLSRDVAATAEAIVDLAVANMYREISRLFSQVGEEPSGYALLAFGGAGPMLGCLVAEAIGMEAVIIPETPGVLAALGGLLADLRSDFVRVVFLDMTAEAMGRLARAFEGLAAEARDWLHGSQGHSGEAALTISGDMRYRGQSYEIETPLEAAWIAAGDQAAITAAFHAKHAEIYGHADDKAAVQIVALRVVIAGRTPKPALPAREMTRTHVVASRKLTVTHRGADIAAGLFERRELPPGSHFDGPAVVIQDDSTTWVPPGFTGEVDAYANLILRRSGMERSSMT
ncbi:hydantoinase/oxoprolinase family protein [Bosea psychrotolerans]|uniref:N-methylhydantoinase A n=1 Tax=Bosea psychrotolerans TaxID=1871628 RepID=A0A2S4LWW5_9HYPH|nr:hydantoinase/oxoprolinase family protein [Bosea psychrotolerans]POR46946.1 N-methylhydantoinase A [Bosea psychrotolerans]